MARWPDCHASWPAIRVSAPVPQNGSPRASEHTLHQLLLASWEVARLRQGVNEPAKRACRSSRLRLSTSSSSSRRSIVWPMLARSSFSSRASSVWVMPGLRKISQYTPLRPREPELFNRRIKGPAQTPRHFLHKKEQPIGIGEETCPLCIQVIVRRGSHPGLPTIADQEIKPFTVNRFTI